MAPHRGSGGAPQPEVVATTRWMQVPAVQSASFRSQTQRMGTPAGLAPGPGQYNQSRADSMSRCRHAPEVTAWASAPSRQGTTVKRPEAQEVYLEVGSQYLGGSVTPRTATPYHWAHRDKCGRPCKGKPLVAFGTTPRPSGPSGKSRPRSCWDAALDDSYDEGSTETGPHVWLGPSDDSRSQMPKPRTGRAMKTQPIPMSAFASATPRDGLTKEAFARNMQAPDEDWSPGPGEYQRVEYMGEARRGGVAMHAKVAPFGSTAKRRTHVKLEVGDTVGPGDYDLPSSISVGGSPRGDAALAFGATSTRFEARAPAAEGAGPGPGRYHWEKERWRRAVVAAEAEARGAAFATKAARFPGQPSESVNHGPSHRTGAPMEAQRQLNAMVREAIERPIFTPDGQRVSMESSSVSSVPSPGDYVAPSSLRQGLVRNHPQDEAFGSALPRFGGGRPRGTARIKTPGPGTYDPRLVGGAGERTSPTYNFGAVSDRWQSPHSGARAHTDNNFGLVDDDDFEE